MLPGNTQEYRIFGHHFLKVLITNTVYDVKGWTYQLYISQEYHPPYDMVPDVDTVGIVELDSLCMRFDCVSDTLCPVLQERREPIGPAIQDGIVIGPAFDWGIMTVPEQCDSLALNFVAFLTDRQTGEREARQEVELRLHKKKRTVGTFLR